jgi:hypothetical protein
MVRLTRGQWLILALPIATIISFLLFAAGWQIHQWGLNWIWAVITLVFVGWRWLLVQWTRPVVTQVEAVVAEVNQELAASVAETPLLANSDKTAQAESALQSVLAAAAQDLPLWEDWPTFWQRCQTLIAAIAQIYHPEVKYPLLNIYIPQAYTLLRGTVDDLDQWMQKLTPALNQMTLGQAYQAYEVYQKLEPSARKLWRVWGWAQWLLNPAAAIARRASQRYGDQANQALLINLSQLLREATLRTLCRRSIALYSGKTATLPASTTALPASKTQTLQEILERAEPPTAIATAPVNLLLVGRTGAGKSSLINTLFPVDQAVVDVLPNTDRVQSYRWQSQTGEALIIWDTPGYEQINRSDLRSQILEAATPPDLVLLLTPALDPALQMDTDFLQELKASRPDLPVITLVTQVDRLRPVREWQPPYDWQWGTRAKEIAIREAVEYRSELSGAYCDRVMPIVTGDRQTGRVAWGADPLSTVLVETIAPAQQLRLARFLKDLQARAIAAAKIIDHYTFQMATTQGLAAFLKSPVLQFLSTLSTGTPTLAYVLAEKIPVEQLPLVIGKLQMAYELFSLLHTETSEPAKLFELPVLWPLLIDQSAAPDRSAWALGHALVEYWTQDLSPDQLKERFQQYLA